MSQTPTPTASTVRRTVNAPTATNQERGYIAAWNMQSEEFPIESVIQCSQVPVVPVITVLPQNGLQPMNVPTTGQFNWNWMRVILEKPSDAQAPLVIETLMLKGTEFEPPVAAATQYIRVVIRNYIIPTETKPEKE